MVMNEMMLRGYPKTEDSVMTTDNNSEVSISSIASTLFHEVESDDVDGEPTMEAPEHGADSTMADSDILVDDGNVVLCRQAEESEGDIDPEIAQDKPKCTLCGLQGSSWDIAQGRYKVNVQNPKRFHVDYVGKVKGVDEHLGDKAHYIACKRVRDGPPISMLALRVLVKAEMSKQHNDLMSTETESSHLTMEHSPGTASVTNANTASAMTTTGTLESIATNHKAPVQHTILVDSGSGAADQENLPPCVLPNYVQFSSASVDLYDDDDDRKMPARTTATAPAATVTQLGTASLASATTEMVASIPAASMAAASFPDATGKRKRDGTPSKPPAAKRQVPVSWRVYQQNQVLNFYPKTPIDQVRSLLFTHRNVQDVLQQLTFPENETEISATAPTATVNSIIVHAQERSDAAAEEASVTGPDSFPPSALYLEQAKVVLAGDFPFLSLQGATYCLAQSNNHYATCHEKLLAAVKGDENDGKHVQYDRVLAMKEHRELDKQQKARVLNIAGIVSTPIVAGNETIQPHCNYAKVFLKNARKSATKNLVTDPVLVEEIRNVSAKTQKWLDDLARQKEQAQKDGTIMECQCCWFWYPFVQMIQCREAHLFCRTCVETYANNQIFGSNNLGVDRTTKKLSLELQCFEDGCPSHFERAFLVRALPDRLLEHYDRLQSKLNIGLAGLSHTVYTCPKCDAYVAVPARHNVVQCTEETCRFASCRECGEAAHMPYAYVVEHGQCPEMPRDSFLFSHVILGL
jgi:hypothetical protein